MPLVASDFQTENLKSVFFFKKKTEKFGLFLTMPVCCRIFITLMKFKKCQKCHFRALYTKAGMSFVLWSPYRFDFRDRNLRCISNPIRPIRYKAQRCVFVDESFVCATPKAVHPCIPNAHTY